MNLSKIADHISNIVVLLLAFLLPLFFAPFTTEFFDTGKLILVTIAISLLLLCWGVKLFTENRFTVIKTPLDIFLIIYLVVVTLSTFLSGNIHVSIYGLLPKIQGSLVSQAVVVLLYFLVVANIKKAGTVSLIVQLFIGSSIILSLVGLASYFQLYLPFSFAKQNSFSLAGSTLSSSLFLVMMIPLMLMNLIHSSKNISLMSIFYFLAMLLAIVYVVLLGNAPVWVLATFAILATLYIYLRNSDKRLILKGLFTPLMIVIVIVASTFAILSYTPTIKDKTVLGKFAGNFTKEIQLPFNVSWRVAASAFRDSPILGTGPGTFLYDFTAYKPIDFNQSPAWNVRFNSGFNQYLQTWAETGGVGVILLLLVSITFVITAIRYRDLWGLGVAGTTFMVALMLSPITFMVQATGFFICALFMASLKNGSADQKTVELPPLILIRILLFLPILGLIILCGFTVGKFVLADSYHRDAINSLTANQGLAAYNSLVKSERINPDIDLYRIDLAQTNIALANSIASQKKPTEASPGGSLTDQDKSNIQTLIQQAIAEGRAATKLAPRSAANWEVLGSIYRQISGVATNGLQFSLDAYGQAIRLDPYNPLLRLAVGGIYYQIKNYDLAVRFFEDVVSLKPDYPNGLYNLAIALRDKGNTNDAIKVTERLVAQLQDKPDSQDYMTASKLLSELKDTSVSSDKKSIIATPSAALEQKNLPQVVDLPEPDNISTPAAVKKEQ